MITMSDKSEYGRELARFTTALRRLRHNADNPSYRAMSAAPGVYCSHTSLYRAATNHRLPTWEVTKAFVQACHGGLHLPLWHQFHIHVKRVLDGESHRTWPAYMIKQMTSPDRLSSQRTSGDFHRVLRERLVEESLKQLRHNQNELDHQLWRQHDSGRGRRPMQWFNTPFRLAFPLPPVTNPAELAQEMRKLKESSGMSYQQISARLKPGTISTNAVADLCNPRTNRLPHPRTLHSFLTALDKADQLPDWMRMHSELANKFDGRYRAAPEQKA